jgi:hypothetical protein
MFTSSTMNQSNIRVSTMSYRKLTSDSKNLSTGKPLMLVFYHDFYEYNRSLRELSVELTRLQHLDQICMFILPRLATLLNATGAALLTRTQGHSWRSYLSAERSFLPIERLTRIANLALTHPRQRSDEPLLLDGERGTGSKVREVARSGKPSMTL